MRGLPSFFLCLAPGILAMAGLMIGREKFMEVALVLIALGAVGSGICVAYHIHHGMAPKGQANAGKVALAVVLFVVTAAAYVTIGLAGCCGAMIATS